MKKILPPAYFDRPVVEVAEDLIGKYLVRKIESGGSGKKGKEKKEEKEIALLITETEAYDGEQDLACHASKGKTKRTEVLFGKPGIWYVYLVYGMYEMLNVVTGKEGYAAGVLIRGVGEYTGPGKLTRALSIGRDLHGKKAARASGLWIEDRGEKIEQNTIVKTPRIGVEYAGPVWAKKPYRFVHSVRFEKRAKSATSSGKKKKKTKQPGKTGKKIGK